MTQTQLDILLELNVTMRSLRSAVKTHQNNRAEKLCAKLADRALDLRHLIREEET